MKKIIFGCVIGILTLWATQAVALELLVLSGETSTNSKRWKEEVFPGYGNSAVGKTLPAKIVTIRGREFPDWLNQALQEKRVQEILGTPTFIIWDGDRKEEVGRVEGYTQKPRFYSQMDEAMAMIEQGLTPGRREGSGGEHQMEGSGGERQMEGSGGEHRMEGSNGGQQNEGSSMSRDIMDHIYKTPEEAKRASELLGFGGEIHTHETPNGTIYMPGPMM